MVPSSPLESLFMHVLLALDGSDESLSAARLLTRVPFSDKPRLTVVTALTDSPYDLIATDRSDWLRDTEQTQATERFDTVKAMLGDRFSQIDYVVEREHPNQLITETAQSHSVDLIVMGARGHSAVYRAMLGSTADYIANHAKCSVLIVRSFEDGSQADFEVPYSILLAYDGSEPSQEAVRQLCMLQWPAEAEVHVTMVLERPKLLPDDVVYDPPQIAETEQALANLQALNSLVCNVKRSVREAVHVGNSISDLAERERCHLLFIGGTGKSAIARFFLGSASRYVLHQAHCPLWIARKKQWD